MILTVLRLTLIILTGLALFLITVPIGESWQQGYFQILGWLGLIFSVPLLALVQWLWWKRKMN